MYISDKTAQKPYIQRQLEQLVQSDQNDFVRGSAVKKLLNEQLLEQLALHDRSAFIRCEATKKINSQEILLEIYSNDNSVDVRLEATKKITDLDFLVTRLESEKSEKIRTVIIGKLSSNQQDLFAKFAMNDPSWTVRHKAIWKSNNPDIIFEVAKSDANIEVRKVAINKLSNSYHLRDIVLKEQDKILRELAIRQISDEKILFYLYDLVDDEDLEELITSKITNVKMLEAIIENTFRPWVKEAAIQNLVVSDDNLELLCNLAINDNAKQVRKAALHKITDDNHRYKVILASQFADTCKILILKMESVELLTMLRMTAPPDLQNVIQNRINDLI